MRYLPLLLIPLFCFGAEKKVKKYDLSDFAWNKPVYGPNPTEASLKDKAVVICLWINHKDFEPEAGFQRIIKAQGENSDKFVVIAAENNSRARTPKEADEIVQLVKSLDLKFTVTLGGLKKSVPREANLIPYAYVFDTKKNMIYSGALGALEFREAMAKAVATPEKTDGKSK